MRAILLDLDDTLLDDRHATAEGFAALVSAHQRKLAHTSRDDALRVWRTAARRHWERYEKGELSFQGQRRERVRDFFGDPLNDEEADAAFLIYQRAYEASWALFPDAAEFLIRTRGTPKIIITNGDRDAQLRKVTATGLAAHVQGVVTPVDCGYWKPNIAIFRAATELLMVSPEDCLMIGDDQTRDIEPAIALGMKSFRVEPGVSGRGLLDAIASA